MREVMLAQIREIIIEKRKENKREKEILIK